MKSIIRFVVSLLMPIILIASGGMLTGWALSNSWQLLAWAGNALMGAGVIWGLVLWLWFNGGEF